MSSLASCDKMHGAIVCLFFWLLRFFLDTSKRLRLFGEFVEIDCEAQRQREWIRLLFRLLLLFLVLLFQTLEYFR